jgi:hypothetical protein
LALATATFTWTNLAIVVIAGAVGGFAGAFASTLAAGGSVGQAFQAGLSGALWGGISAGLAFGIGHVVAPALSNAIGISKEIIAGVGHVAVGGALSEAQGGDFWSGALAAGAGVVAGMVSQKWITNTEMPGILGRTAIAAIAGGTAAELSGGKFANGAMTSAMQHLFNHEAGNIFNRGANLDPFESDGTAMWDSLAGKNQIGAVAKGLGAGAEALMVAAPAPKVGFLARLGSRIKQLFVAARGTVRHGPMNPGPLADDIANTFRSGSYTARTLDQPTTLYRVIGDTGNPAGSYWTATRPQGPLQSVIDLALDQNWGNTATTVIRAQVPAGTRIYEGAAAAQRGLVGGGNQIYIPQVNPSWIQP